MHTLGRKILAMTLSGVIAFNSAPVNIWGAETVTESQSNHAADVPATEPATQPASQEQTNPPETTAETNPPTEANVPAQTETSAQMAAPEQTETSAETDTPAETLPHNDGAEAAVTQEQTDAPIQTELSAQSFASTLPDTQAQTDTESGTEKTYKYEYVISLNGLGDWSRTGEHTWTLVTDGDSDAGSITLGASATIKSDDESLTFSLLCDGEKYIQTYVGTEGTKLTKSSSLKLNSQDTIVGKFTVVAPLTDEQARLSVKWNDGTAFDKGDANLKFKVMVHPEGAAAWTDYADIKGDSLVIDASSRDKQLSNESKYIYRFDNQDQRLYSYLYDAPSHSLKKANYCLALQEELEGYSWDYLNPESEHILHLTKKVPFEATVTWHDKSNGYLSRPELNDWISSLKLVRYVEGTDPDTSEEVKEVTLTVSSEDQRKEGYITLKQSGEGNADSWQLVLPNTLGYAEDNRHYNYYLQQNEGGAEINNKTENNQAVCALTIAEDQYDKPSYTAKYDNVGNFAADKSELFSGGTMDQILTGKTRFVVNKVWKDNAVKRTKEGDEIIKKRPQVQMDLWVYPETKGADGYKSASPVAITDANKIQVDNTIDTNIDTTITYLGTADEPLPRFDADGVELVYFAKERKTAVSEGNTYTCDVEVNQDGKASHRPADFDKNTGGAFKNYVWNGDTIINRITGTTSIKATKTWVAADRADLNAEVTLQLQYKLTSEADGKYVNYPNADSDAGTYVLEGFKAERPSKSHVFTGLPVYDLEGRPYSYRVVEKSVAIADQPGEATSFTTAKVNGSDIWIVYTGDNEKKSVTITCRRSPLKKENTTLPTNWWVMHRL